jgi:hypothetical protein
MRFEDFIKKGQVKHTSKDIQLIKALINTADQDLEFLKQLALTIISARKIISNYYDVLRSILEAIVSLDGYKVYSHEAFTYYLKEKEEEDSAIKFDRFRKIRNSINYYGKEIKPVEAKEIVDDIIKLVDKMKSKLSKKLKEAE